VLIRLNATSAVSNRG
jgi:hypothetical protein